jgi:Protein of unknown function (DUF4231)
VADSTSLPPDSELRDAAARAEKATLERLESQIAWYDRRSSFNRRLYKGLKTIIITSASAIPVLTTSGLPHGTHLAAALGVMIAVLEGVQQLNQHQANWASYRTTAEALKREKYFYLAQAGSYQNAQNRHVLLSERIEALFSQENAKWFMGQAQSTINDPLRTIR